VKDHPFSKHDVLQLGGAQISAYSTAVLGVQRAPRSTHVSDGSTLHCPRCTQQGAPARGPMRTYDLLECTYHCTNAAPSCCILHPEAAHAIMQMHLSLHHLPPFTTFLCPACTFVDPIKSLSGTGCSWGTLLAHRGAAVGDGPIACPSRASGMPKLP